MERHWPYTLILVLVACFGTFIFAEAVRGMKRGEYKYRGAWFHKGEDGIGFWLVTGLAALMGVGCLLCSLKLLFDIGLRLLALP